VISILEDCLKDVIVKQSASVKATDVLCAETTIDEKKSVFILNIGAFCVYSTILCTSVFLTLPFDDFFSIMRHPNKTREYFVDRDPTYFPAILNYFRVLKSGGITKLRVDNLDANEAKSLADAINFYQIQSLSGWGENHVNPHKQR
jgi:hypothetical protein